MTIQVNSKFRSARDRVLSGSVILLSGLGLVTGINFAYNIAVARFLGPTGFGHTTAVYTLLILISAVTLSFQILTAKIVAQQETLEAQSVAYRDFHWRGWGAGLFVGLVLLLSRNTITSYLNLPNSNLIVLLAIGTAFYVPLGARRGFMQGVCGFRRLATNLVLEGTMRLAGSLLLIAMGQGVTGVIGANAAAVIIAYFAAQPRLAPRSSSLPAIPVAFREGLQAAVFFAGQVVINNCDIVVVKHFFSSDAAGLYSAVAMVGRVIFAFSWAVVSSMFPIVAQTGHRKQEHHGVLGTSLLLVLGICLVFATALWLAPGRLWTLIFGSQFGMAGGRTFSSLLLLYAVSTGIYALSVVIIAYEMSRKIANTGWVQLVVSGAVIAGIYAFHSSLAQVIWVQIVMMIVLLLCVAIPFLLALLTSPRSATHLPLSETIRLHRAVSEDEVIAEFLKNDFESPEFTEFQDAVSDLVTSPNLEDADENEVRRALLFIRHGALWRELPHGTQWFEVEVRSSDLSRIRVFPRSHWRKLALGDFTITRIVQRLADDCYRDPAGEEFVAKIHRLGDCLQNRERVGGAILLIGVDQAAPLTVLDGNHRFVASLLASPESVNHFRFFCGLSPRMRQCCWYQTNVATLARYAKNLLRYVVYDPEEEVMRLLQRS